MIIDFHDFDFSLLVIVVLLLDYNYLLYVSLLYNILLNM